MVANRGSPSFHSRGPGPTVTSAAPALFPFNFFLFLLFPCSTRISMAAIMKARSFQGKSRKADGVRNAVREGNSKRYLLHHHPSSISFCLVHLILKGGFKPANLLNFGQVIGILAGGQHGFSEGLQRPSPYSCPEVPCHSGWGTPYRPQPACQGTDHSRFPSDTGFSCRERETAWHRTSGRASSSVPVMALISHSIGFRLPLSSNSSDKKLLGSNKLHILNGQGIFSQKSRQTHC